jgi:hypothetical protein
MGNFSSILCSASGPTLLDALGTVQRLEAFLMHDFNVEILHDMQDGA